jgi:fructose-specific phosphotransferase system component IIB
MSELTLPQIGTYAFGEDVTLEEAATELRSKLKPEYVGTPYEGIYNRIVDLSVERADPTQFAIDRTLLGEAYAGIRRGISGTLGSAIRGIEEIPEALLNEELFGNYFQEWGDEIISDALRDYKPGRDYEWVGGLGEAVGSAGTFLTAGLIGAGVGAGALALAPAAGISSAIGGALVAGGLGVLVN